MEAGEGNGRSKEGGMEETECTRGVERRDMKR